ncbi:hypothetical protein C8J56DRAFT_940152 [Mycena floridula]|nr:hypothetical protein C8J56DRAFT_940152 [Mycena floridula]
MLWSIGTAFLLIQWGWSAALTISVPATLSQTDPVICTWSKNSTDPNFSLVWIADDNKGGMAVLSGTDTDGQLNIGIHSPGVYALSARPDIKSDVILAQTAFQVLTSVAGTSAFSSHSSGVTSSLPSGLGKVGATSRTSTGVPAIFTGTSNGTSGPETIPQSAVKVNIGAIVGSIFGGVFLCLLLGLLWFFCIRRRKRSAVPDFEAGPNRPALLDDIKGGVIVPHTFDSNPGATYEITSRSSTEKLRLGPVSMSETRPTGRQHTFEFRADDNEKQRVESHSAMPTTSHVPSPELARALMTENIRQNAEIERLRSLISSDSGSVITDAPPPYISTQ